MLPACLKMLFLLVLALGATIQHLNAQSVYLEALDLPLAVHYVTYYAMSESTLAVGTFYLPLCSPFKDGQFVEMKGQSRTLARRAPIRQTNGDNSLSWNFTAFPVMMPWLSGTYRCYTSTAQSRRTYTLRVIVPPNLTCDLGFTSTKRITCLVSGYPLPNVTWRYGYGIVTDTPPSLDDGVFTFNSTLTISVSANMAAGQQIVAMNVTAQLPAFSCTRGKSSSVKADCQNMRRSATVTISSDCQEYNESLLVPSSPASTHFNTTVMTSCKAGFKLESGADVAYIVCRANRTWSEFPKCIDAVDCPGACADVHANCTAVRGSYICTCGEGYTGDGSLTGGCIDVTTTRSSPAASSSPTLDPLTTRQNTNTTSPVDRPTSETPSMNQSSTDVQGSETATHGMPLWIPIAIAVPCVIGAGIAILIFAKRRREPDQLRKTSDSCRPVARAQAATQNDAYEYAERIDIRATRNAAYEPCPATSRQPELRVIGSKGAVVYEDAEIMESTTRNAAYTLTSVPNQPNYVEII